MQYEIIADSDSIIINTKKRLNLESKDWRKNLKKDIVNALRGLTPKNQYLMAKLKTTENKFFDVENILFYNIGTSNFSGLDSKGVWFTLDKSCKRQDFNYTHEYSFVNSIENARTNIIAEWNNVIIDKPTTSKKPLDYWFALKKSENIIINEDVYKKEFGIYLEIFKPKSENVRIVNIQKALLDGVISAFHKVRHVDSAILNYLSTYTGRSIKNISDIINNSYSCLSERAVIQNYKDGIKWNPEDEKCVDVRIIIRDSEEDTYKISGYLFAK